MEQLTHQLDIGGMAYNAKLQQAFTSPTALSPLELSYGADSCADHMEPSELTGSVFVPEYYADGLPRLQDHVHLATWGAAYTECFRGPVDEISMQPYTDGPTAAALIPNSRNMSSTAGWTISYGATEGENIADNLDAAGATISGTIPPPADFTTVWFVSPLVPWASYEPLQIAAATITTDQAQFLIRWVDANGAVLAEQTPWTDNTTGGGSAYLARPFLTDPVWGYGAPAVGFHLVVRTGYQPGNGEELPVLLRGATVLDYPAGIDAPHSYKRPRPAGHFVTFKAQDEQATAARLRVGDTPWPAEGFLTRMARINATVPAGLLELVTPGEADGQLMMGARDVDNQSPLELYRRTLAAQGLRSMADPRWPGQLQAAPLPTFPNVLALDPVTLQATVTEDPNMPTLPASAIENERRVMALADMANIHSLGYLGPEGEGTETLEDAESVRAYGPMARKVETDLHVPAGGITTGRAPRRAEVMLAAQSRPYYRLADGLNLVDSQLPAGPQIENLLGPTKGFAANIRIENPPPTFDPWLRVTGAKIRFGSDRAMQLSVEPSDYSGAEPVTLAGLRDTYYGGDRLKISQFDNLTFEQLERIST